MFARRIVSCAKLGRTFCVNKDNFTTTLTMMEVKKTINKYLGIENTFTPSILSREYLLKNEPKLSDLPPRSMQDSFTSAIIPLSTDPYLQERYITAIGYVRLGRLMEDMDMFAVWVLLKHVKILNYDPDTPLPFTFVTILVDKIKFTDVTTRHNADVRLSGHVTWVGKSSVEVVVWLEQMIDDEWQKITRALFLMGSRNATNTKALAVNPLVPVTEYEQTVFDGGECRKKDRIERKKHTIFDEEPNSVEQKVIHELFTKSIDHENMAFNKRILPPDFIWMVDGKLTNFIFSHPEDRNSQNTVFGGFLMRHALELSHALGHQICFNRPKLLHISDITFNRPVAVSSFIQMHAHLIYTQEHHLEIVVLARVLDPQTRRHITTNQFYFTYMNTEKVPRLMPETYHEAMWYVDGRRRFLNAMGLDGLTDIPIKTIEPDAV